MAEVCAAWKVKCNETRSERQALRRLRAEVETVEVKIPEEGWWRCSPRGREAGRDGPSTRTSVILGAGDLDSGNTGGNVRVPRSPRVWSENRFHASITSLGMVTLQMRALP